MSSINWEYSIYDICSVFGHNKINKTSWIVTTKMEVVQDNRKDLLYILGALLSKTTGKIKLGTIKSWKLKRMNLCPLIAEIFLQLSIIGRTRATKIWYLLVMWSTKSNQLPDLIKQPKKASRKVMKDPKANSSLESRVGIRAVSCWRALFMIPTDPKLPKDKDQN